MKPIKKIVDTSNHASMYLQLDNVIQVTIDEFNKIKDYFMTEIRERETISKTLSKYRVAHKKCNQK